MKKILIISTILISFFLLNEKVNASSRVLNQHNVHFINTNSMSDEEIINFYNKFCLDSNNYNCYLSSTYNINVYINARNTLINNSKYYFMYYDYGNIYNVYINENVMNARLVLSNNNENDLGFGIFPSTFTSSGYPQSYTYYKFNNSSNNWSSSGTISRFSTLTEQNYSSNKENIYFYDTNYHREVLYGTYAGYYIYAGNITYDNQVYSINSHLPIDIYDGLNPINTNTPDFKYKYLDIIDITKLNGNNEIEYRYNSLEPVEFYYTSYNNGELPDGVGCITGTEIYECNISSILDISSNYSFYSKATNVENDETVYVKKIAYDDSPPYSRRTYDFLSQEDFSKYPFICNDGVTDCFSNNYYRSFTIDLNQYVNSTSQYKSQYIYVYYNVDVYQKSWNNEKNENIILEDFTSETINPPTYEENENGILSSLNNTILNPFIEIINKKFPIINQLGTIINNLKFEEKKELPNITFNLSSLGINQDVTIIDLNAYKNVRETLFFFEYFGICIIAIPKLIKNLKESFGGANG